MKYIEELKQKAEYFKKREEICKRSSKCYSELKKICKKYDTKKIDKKLAEPDFNLTEIINNEIRMCNHKYGFETSENDIFYSINGKNDDIDSSQKLSK